MPGPRVNVRRIIFKGNTRTTDEVLRREMRQFEGSWYSQAAIDRSKIRLQRLGYFETVDVETVPVPAPTTRSTSSTTVKETTSGSFVFGLGYSQLSGLTAPVQLSQNNFLGSGNRVSVAAQRNNYMKRYDFSFPNPYFTDERHCRWATTCGGANSTTATSTPRNYSTNSGAAQAVFGLPITETDTVTAMLGIDTNEILVFPGSTPQTDRAITSSRSTSRPSTPGARNSGWARNSLNSFLTPTRGMHQRVWLEITLPGSTVEYYKLNYNISKLLAAAAPTSCSTPASNSATATTTATTPRATCARHAGQLQLRPGRRRLPSATVDRRRPAVLRELLRRWRRARCAASPTTRWARATRRPAIRTTSSRSVAR